MRLGVLSDTHGALGEMNRALQNMGEIDALIHAGDFYADALFLKSRLNVPLHAVAGNCDYPSGGSDELVIDINGYRLLITHGHLYRVKHGLQGLYYKARETGAAAVIFGHTHAPLNLWENEILFFNPGSVSSPQPGHTAGYGILNIDGEGIQGKLYSL